uniref:Immunoglobulin V-set domain-containing protein n=1 Tax=Ailuropoda melanoleuca TaxID=9646 RepID=A0A7N5KDS5_AILME
MLLSRLLRVLMASTWLGSSIAQKVTQAQLAMLGQEKGAVTLECMLSTSDPSYSLLCYKQPNSYSQQNATDGRYSLNFQKTRKSIQLVISASELEDSAVYICALREATVSGVMEGGVPKPQGSS